MASLIQLLPSSLWTELMEVPHGPAEPPTSRTVPLTPTSTTTRTARRTASSSPVKALKAAKTTHTTTSSATVPSLLAIHVPSSASQPKVSSKQQGSGDLKLPRPASSIKLPLLGADAHLHVPELLKRARVSNLSAAITRMPPPESFRLDTLVPSYCWPNQWLDSTDALPRESKYIAVGWHPTRAHEFQNTSLQQFRSALNIPNVVALGEVGLDYHREASPTGRAQQQTLLSNMCQLAHQYNLPLVVHCRDPDDHQSTTAAEDCMVILSEHLHRYHPVYLHCYNQGLPTFCRWLQVFPEVVLGLSPLALTSHHHPGLKNVIVNLHTTKLLLETDSPYLPGPDSLGYNGVGSPTLIYHLAQQVSQWQETATVQEVLLEARRATQHFYRL